MGNGMKRMDNKWLRLLSLLVLAGLTAGMLAGTAPRVYAQEGDPGQNQPEKKEEAKKEEHKGTPNLILHILESTGWFFGIVLGTVSLALVALIVILAMELRMGAAIPAGFVDEFTDVVNRRQFKQAFELCRGDQSYLARVLTAGMSRLQYGIEDSRQNAMNMVDSIKSGKEQLINYLATIGTLGPMLGLVGTVYGMILAFLELAAGGRPDPASLAGAISHALVVTLLGIALSVPAIFCNTFFRNRLTRITTDTANLSDDLLTQMYHNSKKAGAPAPATAPAPPGPARAGAPTNTAAIRPGEE
jgi:biopolymer transport protein ExbB